MEVEVYRHMRQRPPFLFVDSACAADDLSEVETEVFFSSGFDFFAGHFPGEPIVPGVILIETMTQSARLLLNLRSAGVKLGYLMSVDLSRFLARLKNHPSCS
jgi:3-hydroxyacyl-[acyl-carrier-protein] dehydratase